MTSRALLLALGPWGLPPRALSNALPPWAASSPTEWARYEYRSGGVPELTHWCVNRADSGTPSWGSCPMGHRQRKEALSAGPVGGDRKEAVTQVCVLWGEQHFLFGLGQGGCVSECTPEGLLGEDVCVCAHI